MLETPTTMTTNIVVPADGSPAAEAAAWYAGAVAEARRGTVHVVAAWEPPGAHAQELARTLGRRAEVDAVLADIEGALGAAGLTVESHVRRCGLVAALCAVAGEHDAELIVVPAGWSTLARELRWRASCRVDMLVLDAGEHQGFRPFPVALAR
jgi:nucleotide-binding universal stress UspA family protein